MVEEDLVMSWGPSVAWQVQDKVEVEELQVLETFYKEQSAALQDLVKAEVPEDKVVVVVEEVSVTSWEPLAVWQVLAKQEVPARS